MEKHDRLRTYCTYKREIKSKQPKRIIGISDTVSDKIKLKTLDTFSDSDTDNPNFGNRYRPISTTYQYGLYAIDYTVKLESSEIDLRFPGFFLAHFGILC